MSLPVRAEFNVHISGVIEYAPFGSLVDLHVNQRFLDNTQSVYRAEIDQDGTFILAAEVGMPQVVYLKHNSETLQLFLSPGDTLQVFAQAGRITQSVKFEGKASSNNTFLSDFYSAYPNEDNPFKLTQYKYGAQNYSCDRHMENMMMSKTPENFSSWIEARKSNKKKFLSQRNAQGKLSPALEKLIKSEIKYEAYYFKMMYGDVFRNKYDVKEGYFHFLKDLSINDAQIAGVYTRKFMMAYVNHMNMAMSPNAGTLKSNFDVAIQYLWGRPLAYVQSELIVMAMSAGKLNEVQDCYQTFSKTNPYIEFEEKVVDVYRNAMKYTTGASAPNYRLTGVNLEKVSSEDFSGKVVFLNFWASWCKPCIKKINYLGQLDLEQFGQDFELVHISLDESSLTWKETRDKHNMRAGRHFIAMGEDRISIMRDFEVQVLPASFLIDRHGRFVELPNPLGIEELRATILDL